MYAVIYLYAYMVPNIRETLYQSRPNSKSDMYNQANLNKEY